VQLTARAPSRALAHATAAAAVALTTVLLLPAPARAASNVDSRAAVLSKTASCSTGDIDITYGGSGIERQTTTFTSAAGTLHHYDVAAFADTYDGVEYILSQTKAPPADGTLLAVYTTIGQSPPDATTTDEFFVAYTCDSTRNMSGGSNVVVATCVGSYGTCPKSVQEYLAANAAPAAPPAAALPLVAPRFTG
jgi:hypothetical protein